MGLVQKVSRGAGGIQYRRSDSPTSEGTGPPDEGISVVITLDTLSELPYYTPSTERPRNVKLVTESKKRSKNLEIRLLFPLTVRRFSPIRTHAGIALEDFSVLLWPYMSTK